MAEMGINHRHGSGKWGIGWFQMSAMADGSVQLATLATVSSLLPLVLILLYTSYSTRTDVSPKSPAVKNRNNGVATGQQRVISGRTLLPPTARLLPIAMFNSSLSFFLFSFQVHEKSILLPLMPLTIMMTLRGGKDSLEAGGRIVGSKCAGQQCGCLQVSYNGRCRLDSDHLSMWPLLKRDDQSLQYVMMTILWNYVIGYSPAAVRYGFFRHGCYVSSYRVL